MRLRSRYAAYVLIGSVVLAVILLAVFRTPVHVWWLTRQLSDKSESENQSKVVRSLADIGDPAVPSILRCLDDPARRQRAVDVLSYMGGRGVSLLTENAKSGSSESRAACVYGLNGMLVNAQDKPLAEPIVDALAFLLDSDLRDVREAAMNVLGEAYDNTGSLPRAFPVLLRLMTNESGMEIGPAQKAILHICQAHGPTTQGYISQGSFSEDAVNALCDALRTESPDVRRSAFRAFVHIAEKSQQITPLPREVALAGSYDWMTTGMGLYAEEGNKDAMYLCVTAGPFAESAVKIWQPLTGKMLNRVAPPE